MRRLPAPARLLLTLTTCAVALVGAAPAAAGEQRVGTAPAAAPAGAQALGPLPSSTPVTTTVVLRPRDPAALAAYAAAVSDPASPAYHRFLTVAQFAARFAPTAQEVEAVRAALIGQGLTLGPLAPNGLSFSARADAGGVGRAFGVSLRRWRLRGGAVTYRNSAAPALPSAIAPLVQSVEGLDTAHALRPADLARAPRASAARLTARVQTGGPTGCGAASRAAYTADQIAAAYGFSGLYGTGDLGQGQTVALIELEPFSPSDISTYEACYGIGTAVSTVTVDGGAGTGSGAGEAALDIEDIAGLAPRANLAVYEGPNNGSGPYDTLAQIVHDDTAHVISTSWGICEAQLGAAGARAEATLLQEAAAQGQTVFAPAGDTGADDCGDGTRGVDDPASQPYVTGVGGTRLPSPSTPGAQTVWNDGTPQYPAAGGGGTSGLWGQPSWQSARAVPVPGSCAGLSACREVPDVSADADPATGYAIYYSDQNAGPGWYSFGGTSAAAPTWAALTALTDASAACAGRPVGFVDPALYTRVPAGDFTDITAGDNAVDQAGGYPALPGYDMASGLGTPLGTQVALALCSGGASTTTTTSSTTTKPPTSGGGGASTPTTSLSSPGDLVSRVGSPVSVRLLASDRRNLTLTFSATGLPPGLSLGSRTGVISGRPTRASQSTVRVRVSDSSGNSSSTSFRWTVDGRPSVRRATLTHAQGRIGLVVGLAAGTYAPGLVSIELGAAGITFSGSGRALARSVSVWSGTRRLRVALSRDHGRLHLRLVAPAGTVTVRIGPGAIAGHRGVGRLRLSGTVRDAGGVLSTL